MSKGHWTKDNAVTGVHVLPDAAIALALANDEMVQARAPMSYITVRMGDQWGDAGGTAWDSIALTGISQPRRQLVLIGPTGEVYVTGSGDRHEEEIVDGTFTPKTLGLMRDVTTLDGTVFACGMKRQVYRRDIDGSWHCISQSIAGGPGVCGFEAIDGFSATDLYVVGWAGEIWHGGESQWQRCDSPCGDVLIDVCCGGDGVVYAIARGRTLVTGRSGRWSAQPIDLPVELTSLCWFGDRLHASSTRDVFTLEPGGRFVPVAIGPDVPETCGELSTNGTVLVAAGARDVFAFDGARWTRID